MSGEVSVTMLATRRPCSTTVWSALAAAIILGTGSRAVRADDRDDLRLLAVAAREFDADARRTLNEAFALGKREPAKAAEMLRRFLPRLEADKLLSAARRKSLLDAYEERISDLERAAARLSSPVPDKGERDTVVRDRRDSADRETAKATDIRQTLGRIAELRRQGKLEEAYQLSASLSRKYGSGSSGSPAVISSERSTRFADNLSVMRRIRNERDQRYIRAMREVVRSSMPIDGDIEFPRNWRELTKRRLKPQLTAEEQKLLKALNTRINTSIKEKPLQGVLDYLKETTGLDFDLDKGALEQLMINGETTVSGDAKNISTRSYIKNLLANVGLTYVIRQGKLYITTPERASQLLVVKTYYIGDLIGLTGITFGGGYDQLAMIQNVAALIDMIKSIEPTSWRDGGGPGTIAFSPLTMSIVVKQTAEMQLMLQGGGLSR